MCDNQPPSNSLSSGNIPNSSTPENANIWYPLAGPPKTEEERKRLKEAIDKEHEQLMMEFGAKSAIKLEVEEEIERVAKANCADLMIDWRNCLRSISRDRFFTMCSKTHEKVQRCVSLQTNNLYLLGYHKELLCATGAGARAGKDENKLENLSDRADEMYLMTMNEKTD